MKWDEKYLLPCKVTYNTYLRYFQDRKNRNILSCYFSKYIYNLAHQTKYLHRENWIYSGNVNCHGLLFPRNSGKAHTFQSILPVVFILPETKTLTSIKTTFYPVSMLLVQLALMNIFYSMWWLEKSIVDIFFFLNHYVVAFFQISVLKEVCILRYLHKNITNIKVPK